jgi:hypothetical protein
VASVHTIFTTSRNIFFLQKIVQKRPLEHRNGGFCDVLGRGVPKAAFARNFSEKSDFQHNRVAHAGFIS